MRRPPGDATGRHRLRLAGVAANVGLAALSGLLCLIMAELALTVAGFEYTPLRIEVAQRDDARAYHVFEDRYFVYDPDLIWRPRSGYVVFNAQGFRGPELPAIKSPASIRVFAVGDSNTLGWAGEDGPNWPAYLGELMQAQMGREAVVVNAGVWGYSSYQGVKRVRETLRYDPDLVLISFGSNDGHPVERSDRDYGLTGARMGSMALDQALSHLRVGQLLLGLVGRFGATGEITRRVPLAEYRENLRIILAEARERGVTVVLMTRPYIGDALDRSSWKVVAPDYNRATVEIAREQHVALVDLYSLFREREPLFDDESHFTEEGHRLAAQLVFDVVRTALAGR